MFPPFRRRLCLEKEPSTVSSWFVVVVMSCGRRLSRGCYDGQEYGTATVLMIAMMEAEAYIFGKPIPPLNRVMP